MNRVRDAVSLWRGLIDRKRLKVVSVLAYGELEAAVHVVIDDALTRSVITLAERDSLRAILARSVAGEADAAERTVLSEALLEMRGRVTPLVKEHGEKYRVLHRRLI